MFTADNLPEEARASEAMASVKLDRGSLNALIADALNGLCASRPGLRERLLNGTAPAFTDEPPEVTKGDVEAANEASRGHQYRAMKPALEAFIARVWQAHRPAPVDPARFELGKVSDLEIDRAYTAAFQAEALDDSRASAIAVLRAELSRILPVAEPLKQWAKLTDEVAFSAVAKAASNWSVMHDPKNVADVAASLRASLSAYAPPPRKVEVTLDVVNAVYGTLGYQPFTSLSGNFFATQAEIDKITAAVDFANAQANARESEAVAEVARLRALIGDDHIAALSEGRARIIPANQAPGMPNAKCHACGVGDYCGGADCPNAAKEIARLRSENAAYETSLQRIERLTKEVEEPRLAKIEAAAFERRMNEAEKREAELQAHTDKLEAMLTVDGVDGPVNLWEPFERRYKIGPVGWEAAELALGYSVGGTPQALFDRVAGGIEIRQTPAPEAELKRWKIVPKPERAFAYLVTHHMTRADAEKIGEVIGEAE